MVAGGKSKNTGGFRESKSRVGKQAADLVSFWRPLCVIFALTRFTPSIHVATIVESLKDS